VDESREYGNWAEWLGVPRHTFSAVFGAVIANGLDYRDTFQVFRPGFDLANYPRDLHRSIRAGDGNRNRMTSLEDRSPVPVDDLGNQVQVIPEMTTRG
jgi:hypothetical protein